MAGSDRREYLDNVEERIETTPRDEFGFDIVPDRNKEKDGPNIPDLANSST
jgi:hypothetical protein